MPANRTPLATRFMRLARLALHIARGLAIVWLHFPRLSATARHAAMRRWSRTLLAIISVSVREVHVPKALPPRCMLAMNHISWLDIFVIDAHFPATFVAKSEIRNWLVVGWLCTQVGTLYIERGKRAAVRRARETISEMLARGTLIAICPEGKTTFGRSLGRFHAALFQPAIDAEAMLQPVALRYLDPSGRHTDAAAYAGETSLLESLWNIVSTRHMRAEINFLTPISAEGETRRPLAEQAEIAIAAALGVRRPHSSRMAPETDADPPDG
jgi:1-acyl-sn-glycerol-3-phosphate acyltransferase